jgi:SGNH hydrolase-like domain, acetyltransferase AlgX
MRPRIGRLIPATIAIALLLDAATRLIPIDLFTFRAWEALVVAHAPTGPFEPNRVYVNPLSYGDLARSQRYRALRQRRLEYFSTDSWGYRNTVQPSNRPVSWLLLGDSFGVSSGVSDAATLASQLARWSGESVYNASASFPLALGDARFTAGRIGLKSGLVIYEYMERWDLPAIDASARRRIFGEGPPRAARTFVDRLRVLQQQAAVSRMNILAGWAWDAIATRFTDETVSSDTSDPVPGELPTVRFPLANGDTMLFYAKDVEVTRRPDRIIAPQYLITLRTELQKLNLDLAVLVVPTSYHVYASSIADPTAPQASDEPLRRLTETLLANGVFAVNVSDALKQQAVDGLSRRSYTYFLDDTHWNERGIEIAARAFVDARRRADGMDAARIPNAAANP